MLRSIRWTLQLWHAAILLLVLLGFGSASYFAVERSRFMEIDAELSGAAQILAANLHPPRRPAPAPPPPPRREDERRPPEEREGAGVRGEAGPRDVRGEAGPPDRHPPGELPLPFDRLRPDRDPPPRREPAEPPEDTQGRRAIQPPVLELPAGFLERFSETAADDPFFIVRHSDGSIVQASASHPDVNEAMVTTPADGSVHLRQFAGFREAILTTPLGAQIVVGRSVRREQGQLKRLAFLLGLTGAGVLAFGLAGGWFLSRRAVRPIGVMSATAGALSATNLSGRIEVDRVPSELGALAQVLNAAFARLESAFLRQARFTADASHELRTPLAVIHSHAELALSRERSGDEYRQTLATCLKASGRMRSLVDSLLLLARADAGGLEMAHRPFDLKEVVQDHAGLLAPLAHQSGIGLEMALHSVQAAGDPSHFGQVVTNLVTNAIRYNRADGSVRVSTGLADGMAVLTVADTGMGIAPEDQPRVFERFFRADKARSRKAGGSGLGLAICKSIVDAHGGTIAFASVLGQGTTFVVHLPAASFVATG